LPVDTDHPYVVGATGHRLYVDAADQRAQELVRSEGVLAPGSNRLWDAVLAMEAWDVVVDIGANYGEMVLGAAIGDGTRIICFEPNPRVLPFLRRSIEESGLAIDLREVAVGASTGEATFVMDTVWSGRSGLADTHRTDADHALDTVVVPVRTLDSEVSLGDGESVCVKVDVEGAEFDVLGGARSLRASPSGWAIMLEVLHMDPFEKARLATDYTMRVMDRRTGDLVVVPPASPQRVAELLDSAWLHSQDAVLTARDAA
jgi:FkbM family methyltransferase